MAKTGWQDAVLDYWFKELTLEDWFEQKDETDRAVSERFAGLHRELRDDLPASTKIEPKSALAAVIVLDQFPRNLFRRKAEAFSTDDLAIGVARNAVDQEFDKDMSAAEKQFLYMPFMHSEVVADQERSVRLFHTLGDDLMKYAIEHRDIVARFGRFPHRNRALGRQSTDDEIAFLEGHSGFGQ